MLLLKGLNKFAFSSGKMLDLPIVDISNFLQMRSSYEKECKVLVDCLKNNGAALIKDPRIHKGQFNEFFDLMEKYFYTRATEFKQGKQMEDVFPQCNKNKLNNIVQDLYQSGLAPQGSEKQINNKDTAVTESYSIFTKKLLELDPSAQIEQVNQIQMLRLRWRIGNKPKGYRLLDPPRFHPKDFPTFSYTLDRTANYFQQSLFAVAQMCAIGLDLPSQTFTKLLYGGPDILGPTGIDMSVIDDQEQIQNMRYRYLLSMINVFQKDYAFLQIQGNPRYPGLRIWDNNGQKQEANYPSDVCLIQAGLEFEILTGGHIPASHYEGPIFFQKAIFVQVVRKKQIAEELKDKNQAEPWKNWRVSSTQFSHVRHDIMLSPLEKFKNINPEYSNMKPIQAYDLFSQEVKKRFAVSFGDEMKMV